MSDTNNTVRSGTSKKKSQWVASATVPSGAFLDYYADGVNRRISLEDFILDQNLTGSIEQDGAVTGTPVLDKDGSVNKIRNLEDGSGVMASVSAENGITLEHNFSPGADSGIPVLIDETETQPVIRKILAGTGINVASAGESIQITATGITVASNIVIVNEMADFPAAVSGVRTLEDDTAYLVSAALSTSDRFVLGESAVVYGADSAVASLTYTGSDTMFTATAGNSKITLITLSCASGQLIDISGGGVFQLINMTVTACDTVGPIGAMTATQVTDCAFDEVTSGGFSYTGTHGAFVATRNFFTISGGTMFDLDGATFTLGFQYETSICVLAAGTTFMSGLVDSGNIPIGSLGAVVNCRFSGLGTVLNNISERDARWEFRINDNVPNSINSLLCVNAGATVTIAAPNTPVIIGATWTFDHESRFTGDAAGTFTYTGKGAHVSLSASITAEIATATDDCTFYYYKNGVQEADSAISRNLTAGSPGNLSMPYSIDLDTDDEIDIRCENNDTSVNIIINNAILSIEG